MNHARFLRSIAVLVLSVVVAGALPACTATVVDRRPPIPSRPATLPEPPTSPPAAEVWPKAVFTLPTRLGKGLDVDPVAMLSEHEALMVTTFAMRLRFLAYDRRTQRHRVLATAPAWSECDLCFEIRSVAVGEKQIVWTAGVYRSERWNQGLRHVELWSMPRSGGRMKLMTWLTGHYDAFPLQDTLTVDGDQVTWRGEGASYRIPLSGGKPQRIDETPAPPVRLPDTDTRSMMCGVEWCVSQLMPDVHELTTVVIQRRDGSGRTTVPASMNSPLIHDRFGLFSPPYVEGDVVRRAGSSALLYDRCTATTARIGTRYEVEGSETVQQGSPGQKPPILFWKDRGGRYVVVDLSRIPDRPCRS
ncbi:hypothetical protein ACLQ2R_07830 [Streptosporangium sp. DT93]|uniref:hypothetical protein n=1 Tax=Streptosporangium sp. DT93 TaxID=3393428 RepID=UPI003CF24DE8